MLSICIRPAWQATLILTLIFFNIGLILPYLGAWYEEVRSFSGWQIGMILSGAALARTLTSPLLSGLTHNLPARRTVCLLAMIGGIACFIMGAGSSFILNFITGFISITMIHLLGPYVEAIIIVYSKRGDIGFGLARAVGAFGFIIGNIIGGLVIDHIDIKYILHLMVMLWAFIMISGIYLVDPIHDATEQMGLFERFRPIWIILSQPGFVIIALAAGCINASHAFYYTMGTPVWRTLGYDGLMIGTLWAFGVAVEIGVFLLISRRFRSIPGQIFILIGGVGALIRWLGMGFAPASIFVFLLQSLHGLSFALAHMGVVRYLGQSVSDRHISTATILISSIGGGLLMGSASLLSGYLYDRFNIGGYWAMAGITLIGISFIVWAILSVSRSPTTSHKLDI